MNIKIDEKDFEYEINRKNVKNTTLRVRNDGSILITANNKVSHKRIVEFMIEKKDWIFKTTNNIENRIILSNNYNNLIYGEDIILLGENTKVIIEQALKDEVRLSDGRLIVSTKDKTDNDKLNRMINKWISKYAQEVFTTILNETYELFTNSIPYPKLKLRIMKSRWGTCSIHISTITINTLLIHTSRESIEYVIAHELTHFMHANHSRNFYHSLSLVMPDHEEKRQSLKKYLLS